MVDDENETTESPLEPDAPIRTIVLDGPALAKGFGFLRHGLPRGSDNDTLDYVTIKSQPGYDFAVISTTNITRTLKVLVPIVEHPADGEPFLLAAHRNLLLTGLQSPGPVSVSYTPESAFLQHVMANGHTNVAKTGLFTIDPAKFPVVEGVEATAAVISSDYLHTASKLLSHISKKGPDHSQGVRIDVQGKSARISAHDSYRYAWLRAPVVWGYSDDDDWYTVMPASDFPLVTYLKGDVKLGDAYLSAAQAADTTADPTRIWMTDSNRWFRVNTPKSYLPMAPEAESRLKVWSDDVPIATAKAGVLKEAVVILLGLYKATYGTAYDPTNHDYRAQIILDAKRNVVRVEGNIEPGTSTGRLPSANEHEFHAICTGSASVRFNIYSLQQALSVYPDKTLLRLWLGSAVGPDGKQTGLIRVDQGQDDDEMGAVSLITALGPRTSTPLDLLIPKR